jgi:hypothetical protein
MHPPATLLSCLAITVHYRYWITTLSSRAMKVHCRITAMCTQVLCKITIISHLHVIVEGLDNIRDSCSLLGTSNSHVLLHCRNISLLYYYHVLH